MKNLSFDVILWFTCSVKSLCGKTYFSFCFQIWWLYLNTLQTDKSDTQPPEICFSTWWFPTEHGQIIKLTRRQICINYPASIPPIPANTRSYMSWCFSIQYRLTYLMWQALPKSWSNLKRFHVYVIFAFYPKLRHAEK